MNLKAEVLKIDQHPSKYGGIFFYVYFKAENGKSYRSCVDPKMKNYKKSGNGSGIY